MRHQYLQYIYILHVIFALIMIYIGIQYFRGKSINSFWYSALLLMGFAALGYHLYWYLNSLQTKHGD